MITKISDMPEGTYGFIYQITHTPTNKKYIGKKVMYFTRKVKLTKKEIAEQTGPGRKPITKLVTIESDWASYYGSNKEFLSLTRTFPKEEFHKEILELATGKKMLTYYECKYLFKYGAIENNELYYNDNILGKFYRKDFI
jgi:hypothetical protein